VGIAKRGRPYIVCTGIVILILGTWLLTRPMAQPSSSGAAPSGIERDAHRFDAHRLKTGQFTYRMSDRGVPAGTGMITIREAEPLGNYDFSAEFDGFGGQQWEAIATSAFDPVFATLSAGKPGAVVPIFRLEYASGKVKGFVMNRKGPEAGTQRRIDDAVPVNTVDQRIDWAAVLSYPLSSGKRFEFNVYDPSIGISQVMVSVGKLERIQVPVGTFDAYRVTYTIKKATGTEQYQVLATRDLPRILVREEFPDGVVSDLIATK